MERSFDVQASTMRSLVRKLADDRRRAFGHEFDAPRPFDVGDVARGSPAGLTSTVREDRFEQLVRDHRRAVHTYARSMASTPTIAEEAVQDTFLRAWKYLDSFNGTGSFEGWLIRICRRCVIDLETSEKRHDTIVHRETRRVTQSPDQQTETLELVAALPREQREVIVVCGVLGYDYEAAAMILDIPLGTVRSRLHRGRAGLATALEAQPPDRATA